MLSTFIRKYRRGRTAFAALFIASLLAGLLPPPAVTGLLQATLPARLAETASVWAEDLLSAPALAAPNAVDGTVFRDFNSDGALNGSEIGLAGVTVTAYGADGAACGSTTSRDGNGNPDAGALGTYSLTPTCAGPWRVVFSGLPAYFTPSFMGPNRDSVQFVTTSGVGSVDFAVNRSFDYCQANPTLCSPMMINGNHTGAGATTGSVKAVGFDRLGLRDVTRQGATGNLWGVAYSPGRSQLYTSAMVRRHSGIGPAGLGGIYAVNDPGGANSPAWSVSLTGAPFNIDFGPLPDNGTRGLPSNLGATSSDPDAFEAVGKQGIGDIDLSEDGDSLWVVNLYSASSASGAAAGSLLKLDVSGGVAPTTTAQVQQYTLQGIPGLPTCTNGVLRPWALKFRYGKGFLGAVCTAENGGVKADLRGYVFSFDPADPTAGMTTELDIDMTYTKGPAHDGLEFTLVELSASRRLHPDVSAFSPAFPL